MNGGWVLEVDIKAFFDNVDHGHLRSILDLRVQDKGIRRLIGKWLKAGVLEAGTLSYPSSGTPQGGVCSPILANIYLHEALDQWFHQVAVPRLRGKAKLVRFADDLIVVFTRLDDAQKVMNVLSKRFLRFGLTIHPDKTRLVDSRRTETPGHFDFLGFTYYGRRSRKGNLVVSMKTAKNRRTNAEKHPGTETARSLWLLRAHGKHSLAPTVPECSHLSLAKMAKPPLVGGQDDVGKDDEPAEIPSVTADQGRPFHLSRSEAMSLRSRMPQRARPDLWEAEGGNPLGPPGEFRVTQGPPCAWLA